MLSIKSIAEELQAVLGRENVRPAIADDAISGVIPQFVAEPSDEHQLAAALAVANKAGVSVIPRGGGTKLEWGNPPHKAELILSTARLNRIVEHVWADLTLTVEAGCTLRVLQEKLAQHGQRLAFDGLWPERATVGGALSTNDSGVLRLRFGPLRDLIIGITLALPDGTLARSGGKVVKNVAGYDLPKLATGAFGTLGIITRATFRLHPLPRSVKTLSFTAESTQSIQRWLLAIQDSKLAHSACQIRCRAGSPPKADILFEATEAGLSAQESQFRTLLGSSNLEEFPGDPWVARQSLWNFPPGTSVIAKISVVPAHLGRTMDLLARLSDSRKVHWELVAQATGIGILRLEGDGALLLSVVQQLRSELESIGGSFVLLRRPPELETFDAWGNAGDALTLMRAVKHQLDPNNTLNPGRFVGGI
jgi:glycolate oxidase FAD binding subunit